MRTRIEKGGELSEAHENHHRLREHGGTGWGHPGLCLLQGITLLLWNTLVTLKREP